MPAAIVVVVVAAVAVGLPSSPCCFVVEVISNRISKMISRRISRRIREGFRGGRQEDFGSNMMIR